LAAWPLGLYGREALAEDAQAGPVGTGFGGITIAQNQRSPEEVDRVLAEAVGGGRAVAQARADSVMGRLFRLFSPTLTAMPGSGVESVLHPG